MFFVHIGSVIAWLATIMATIRFGIIAWLIFNFEDAGQLAYYSKRYVVTDHPLQAVDKTALLFVFGVLTGILVQIAKNTRK
jgi:hypothetical protein